MKENFIRYHIFLGVKVFLYCSHKPTATIINTHSFAVIRAYLTYNNNIFSLPPRNERTIQHSEKQHIIILLYTVRTVFSTVRKVGWYNYSGMINKPISPRVVCAMRDAPWSIIIIAAIKLCEWTLVNTRAHAFLPHHELIHISYLCV